MLLGAQRPLQPFPAAPHGDASCLQRLEHLDSHILKVSTMIDFLHYGQEVLETAISSHY